VREHAQRDTKPWSLEVRLTDGEDMLIFSTKDPVDLCDECADTLLGILRTRVVLKDSNLSAFTGVEPVKPVATPKAPSTPLAK
jgi:hypothetical protein